MPNHDFMALACLGTGSVYYYNFVKSTATYVMNRKKHNDTTNGNSYLETNIKGTDETQAKEQGLLFALHVCCLNKETSKCVYVYVIGHSPLGFFRTNVNKQL